jgi:hypothetical protein
MPTPAPPARAVQAAPNDADTLRVLETVKPQYERLRSERIRNEGEIERCERDHKAAEENAIATFGTADEGEIRAKIEERRAANADRVGDFRERVAQIQRSLAELDGRPA